MISNDFYQYDTTDNAIIIVNMLHVKAILTAFIIQLRARLEAHEQNNNLTDALEPESCEPAGVGRISA
jgi:hypothetical protein